MDIATGPLSTLFSKLAKLLQDEYKLQKGTRKGIEFLCKELEIMHAALRIVDEVPRDQLNDLQRIWARDVKELSYDMEDIVDTFMVEVEGHDPPSKRGAKKIFSKMMGKFNEFVARREVTQEINNIKERARELAERRDRNKVDDIAPAKKTPVDPRLKALYTDATEIVGIEEAKKEVITMLRVGLSLNEKRAKTRSRKMLRVGDDLKKIIVSIAGFGGLGKTTLAKAVYDEIKGQFDCMAFVSVSRNPDPKKLLMDMLYDFGKAGDPSANSDEIMHRIDLVRQSLQNKRYLIVIDDIWDKEPWDKVIRFALIENNMGSRIITTTRIIDVAEHIGGCYRLKPLSNESSEMLFYGRIFDSKGKCPKQFSEISKKILKKCGGVPLAIVTMSSMLANKSKNIEDWEKVCDSIGSGLAGSNASMDDMRKILLLSYYDLPSHLKTCLLYLSIFPEDSMIRKDRLIWKWVAEGFIQVKKADQSFLEIGDSYFNELLNRSLIQAASNLDMEGIPQDCRVHDTVLDLIISLSSEESFISIVSGDGMETNVSGDRMESKVRWLSVHNNTTWPTMKMPKLRSLTIFTRDDLVIDPTLSRHRFLRVLDLQSCRLKDIASLGFLGGLSHLRYLALSSSYVRPDEDATPDELPVEIGKLRFLQTLDLSRTTIEELQTRVIKGLGQLMCLRVGWNTTIVLQDGLKNLTALEVLESATVTERIAEELGHLTKLRKLVIRIEFSTRDDDELRACGKTLVGSLGKLAKIESLHITSYSGYIYFEGPMEEPLANLHRLCIDKSMFLPTWIKGALLPGLSYLDIKVQFERGEDIQVLGTLPCLRHLRFGVLSDAFWQEGLERCVVGPHAFPSLVSCGFKIIQGRNVVPSMFPRGAMPMLEDFEFNLSLEQFYSGGGWTVDDLGLGHLPSLRRVGVKDLCCCQYDDERDMMRSAREKLEHEAAVHSNHPVINCAYNDGDIDHLIKKKLAMLARAAADADRDPVHYSGPSSS